MDERICEACGRPLESVDQRAGQALAILRMQAGIDQKSLARMVGMSQSSLSRLETGTVSMTLIDMIKICHALEVEIHKVVKRIVDGCREEDIFNL